MRLVFVGGSAHGTVLEFDGSLPSRVTAHHRKAGPEFYEYWDKEQVRGAAVFTPAIMSMREFSEALEEVKDLWTI